jgi:hypothetical protein
MPKEMVALIQKPEIMAAIMGAIVAGMITGIGWTVTTPQKHRNDRREAERVRAHEAQLLSEARSRDVLFACKQIRDLLGACTYSRSYDCWPWLLGTGSRRRGRFRYEGRVRYAHAIGWGRAGAH